MTSANDARIIPPSPTQNKDTAMNARLAAQVKATNTAHKYVPQLYDILAPIFAKFVGEKILKQDREFIQKVRQAIPELPNSSQLDVYRYMSDYTISWRVRASETVEEKSRYHEFVVNIGELQNGVLTKICPLPENLRHDYTVEEITQKRQAVENAKEALNDAQGKLYPFEEYDR